MMTHEAQPLQNTPPAEVMRALEAVAQTGRRRVVQARGKTVALVPQTNHPRSRSKVFTKNDPLWGMVGMFKADGGPTDVAETVDTYLAEASLDTHA